MKKILSVLMSATLSLSVTVSMISYAENAEITVPDLLPCSISDSGDSVIFDGNQDYDYIISTNSKFTTERTNNSTKFTPEENGSFIVSRVWIEEATIYYPIKIYYDMENVDAPDGYKNGQCSYFYPHIQNFEITYRSDTGIEVEFLGERDYINTKTVSDIASVSYSKKDDNFIEMETDDIFDYTSYYTLASCNLLGNDSGAFFMYFDYGCEDKKDRSLFCVDIGHHEYEENNIPVNVSGNAEITKVLMGGSYTDGNLEITTCDEVPYVLIEPTGDGLAEIHSFILNPNSATVLTVENGQFLTERNSLGCEPPETGDLNMDYSINIADAVVFQKYMLGNTKLTSIQFSCADLNCDESVDIFDMVLIKQKIIEDNHMGLIPEPVETVCY